MELDNLIEIILGDSGPMRDGSAAEDRSRRRETYVSQPEIIRYFDNLLAWQMNHSPDVSSSFRPIIQDAENEASNLYSLGEMSEKEWQGVLQFLDMRRQALEAEMERYGRILNERTAIQPPDSSSLYDLPPEDMWEAKEWQNWWPVSAGRTIK